MRKSYTYSAVMMGEAVIEASKFWGTQYELLKDEDGEAYFDGFSPRETRIRLEPFVPFLQECPTKAHITWDESKCLWVLWRDV